MNQLTKGIALLALSALLILCTLGNWWFTFGLWPISWGSFVFFALVNLNLTLTGLIAIVNASKP